MQQLMPPARSSFKKTYMRMGGGGIWIWPTVIRDFRVCAQYQKVIMSPVQTILGTGRPRPDACVQDQTVYNMCRTLKVKYLVFVERYECGISFGGILELWFFHQMLWMPDEKLSKNTKNLQNLVSNICIYQKYKS